MILSNLRPFLIIKYICRGISAIIIYIGHTTSREVIVILHYNSRSIILNKFMLVTVIIAIISISLLLSYAFLLFLNYLRLVLGHNPLFEQVLDFSFHLKLSLRLLFLY